MWVSASHPDMPARQSSDEDADSDDDRLVAFVDISSGQRRLGLFVSQAAQSRLGSLVQYQIAAAAAHPAKIAHLLVYLLTKEKTRELLHCWH